jgi:drug/metabolite transporter (DMT)-like permease
MNASVLCVPRRFSLEFELSTMSTPGTDRTSRPDTLPEQPGKQGFVVRFWPWLVVLFMGNVWGFSFSLAKIATNGGGDPIGIAYWQALLGAILLVGLSLCLKKPVPVNRDAIILYVLCGLLGTAIPGVLFFYAAAHVSAGVMSVTVSTVPIMTFLASAVMGVEKFSLGRVSGVLFGMISIVLLVGPEESLPDRAMVPWVFVALLAAVCYTAENMIIAIRLPDGFNVYSLVCGMFIAATIIMTPFIIVTDSFVPLAWPWGEVEWAIVGMALISMVAYGLFVYVISKAGPVFAAQTGYVVTVTGVIWGMVIFGEAHSWWIWISIALMMVGLALVSPREDEKQNVS